MENRNAENTQQVPIAECECPTCHLPLDFAVKLSIENLRTISMILWTHELPVQCQNCQTVVIPKIAKFDINAISWEPVAISKPLIQRPGMMDVSVNPFKN